MANQRGAYQKKQANIENVYSRYKLLVAGIENPSNVSQKLIKSLAGQRKFASISIEGSKIQALSLNTLKTIADEVLKSEAPGGNGFAYLDSLRCRLRDITKKKKSSRSAASKESRQKEDVKGLRHKLQQADLMNLQRSKAYHDLFSKIVSITADHNIDEITRLRLRNLIEDHSDLYGRLFSPIESDDSNGALRIISGGNNDE